MAVYQPTHFNLIGRLVTPNQHEHDWTNDQVDQHQTPPSRIHNASAIDNGLKYK